MKPVTDPEVLKALGASAPSSPQIDAIDRSALEAMKPSKLERFGRGFADFTQGIKQLALMATDSGKASEYTKQIDEEIARYEKGRGPDAGMDWMRIGGNVAASAPTMLIPGGAAPGLAARMMQGAAAGGLQGALQYTGEDDSKLMQIGVGGVLGGAAPAVIQGGTKLAQKGADSVTKMVRGMMADAAPSITITPKIEAFFTQNGMDWNRLSAQAKDTIIKDAKQMIAATGDLDPAALLRKSQIQAVGGTPTTGMVTRSPAAWTFERNTGKIAQVGDDLRNVFVGNDTALNDYAGALRTGTGGKAGTPYEASENVIDALAGRWKSTGKQVSALYQKVRETKGDQFAVMPERLRGAMDDLGDIADADSITQSVSRRMQRLGILKPDGTYADNAGGLTVNQAEEMRKFIGGLDANSKTKKMALDRLTKALDEDVLSEAGDDVFGQARKMASERFREFSPKPLKAITDGVATPDDFMSNYILRGKVKNLAAVRDSLNKAGPEGTQAWNDMKGQAVEWIIEKSTAGGNQPFSGAQFAKTLKQLGSERVRELFSPDELQRIKLLGDAATAMTTDPKFSAVNYSNTGPMLASLFLKLGQIPGIGAVTGPSQQIMSQQAVVGQIRQALSAAPVDTMAIKQASQAARNRIAATLNAKGMTPAAAAEIAQDDRR